MVVTVVVGSSEVLVDSVVEARVLGVEISVGLWVSAFVVNEDGMVEIVAVASSVLGNVVVSFVLG